jgi:signal peptidase
MRRVLVTLVTVVLSVLVLATALAVHLGYLALQPVLSGSMRPTFQPGDLVITRPVGASTLNVGDVIGFVPPGKSVEYVHRIASITHSGGKLWLTTKGDANRVADPWGRITLRSRTVHEYVTSLPTLGWVATLPKGLIMAVLTILAGVMFLVSPVADFYRHLRRKPTTQEVVGS